MTDQPSRRRTSGGTKPGERLSLARRERPGGEPVWELVHPRCSRRRRDDLEEVQAMLEAGELEIARDELVWLLSECPDFLEAHVQLGVIALEEGDAKLARGHFGRAYELVLRAIEAAGVRGPLPYELPGNRVFYEAAKGLAHTLMTMGRTPMAADVARRATQLDPADTLGIRGVVAKPPQDRKPG
jgi:tetratricopeptide (TPR) repeat protein